MDEKELATTEDGGKGKVNRKRIIIAIAVLAFIYLGGAAYSTFMFLPNTSLRGTDISGLSASAANEKLKDEGLFINVEQKARNGNDVVTDTIDLREVAFAEMDYDTGALLKEQNKFLWFKSFFVPTDFTESKGAGTFDENRLRTAVGSIYCLRKENVVEPQDARLVPKQGYIEEIPEVNGNAVDRNVAVSEIVAAAKRAVKGGGSQTVNLVDLCKEPEVRTTDAEYQESKRKMARAAIRTITINIYEPYKEELYGESIVKLLEFDGDDLKISETAVDEYVKEVYDKYYISMYEYIIQDELKEMLMAALLTSDDEVIYAPWYVNYPYPGCKGNGSPSYVEICLSKQVLWYYENNELILSSDIVTGDPKEFPTPRGYFTIVEKDTNAKLIGRDKEYEVTVNYWMGIEHSGYYGMHDAVGRSAFGGNIYVENGSHGCINLPYGVAEALFGRTYVGTEVYIYN